MIAIVDYGVGNLFGAIGQALIGDLLGDAAVV